MAKLIYKCPTCGKSAETLEEEKSLAFECIIKTLSCGHEITESLIRSAPEGHFLFCKTCNGKVNGACAGHEIVEIPNGRDARFLDAFKFQQEGIKFIEDSNFNCLIADEMGLGKTIQALLAVKYNQDKVLPTLFIVKSALKLNWAVEMFKNEWLGSRKDPLDMPFIISSGDMTIMPGMRYYIISMNLLEKFKKQVLEILHPKLLVIDESQNFANRNSKRTKALLEIAKSCKNKICLSGTPVLNRAGEYWTTLNLIRPDHWPSYESFDRRWLEHDDKGKSYGISRYRKEEFFERTKGYILRRKKTEVLKDLPPFSRHFKFIDLSESNVRNEYNKESKDLQDFMNSEHKGMSGFEIGSTYLGFMSRMRHLTGIGKSAPCAEDVIEFLESIEDEKTIIGCHHDDVMENLKLMLSNYNPVMLPSGLDNNERYNRIEEFRKADRRLCIAKILAQGEGLNLQFCSNMIILERMWNPAKEEQFEARVYRYGQEYPTNADYLIAKGTVDEDFSEIVEGKRKTCGETLDEDFNFELNGDLLRGLAERVAGKFI